MRPRSVTPRTSLAGLLLVVLALLAGCGEAGGDGDGPSVSPTRTPTGTLPSPTRTPTGTLPSPTRTPSATTPTEEPTTPPDTETPTETATPTSPPETETPTETATPTPTETSSEATPETTPTPEEASEEASEAATEDEGVPAWVWWVAAALVLGAVVAVPLVLRARRQAAWRRELERQESEVEWFARSLLPELRVARSHEEMAGGWAVSQRRVSGAEDELTVLESTAPDDAGRARARVLRDASRHARSRMQQLVAPGPHDTWALDLDTIMIELEGVLRPVAPATPPR